MNKYSILAQDVAKEFNGRKILKSISFSIEKGEIFGLLGPSGAGKTTLVKILTGQLAPTAGESQLLGVSVSELDTSIYRRIGMVMDEAGLYERLTCRDNLRLFASLYKVPKRRVYELLERVGLKEAAVRPVKKLSKGMKQRLAFARALLAEPELLFLDEPTSGLDPATAKGIHELIFEARQRGTSVFLTTHNMEEAAKLCDNIALLHEGCILEYGNPADICRKYDHQRQILIRTPDGDQLAVPNDGTGAGLLSDYAREKRIQSIHSTEPTLETVFLELTGRGLYDDADTYLGHK